MGLCLFLELTFKQDGQTLSPLLEKVVVILLLILMVVICTLDVSEASLLMKLGVLWLKSLQCIYTGKTFFFWPFRADKLELEDFGKPDLSINFLSRAERWPLLSWFFKQCHNLYFSTSYLPNINQCFSFRMAFKRCMCGDVERRGLVYLLSQSSICVLIVWS